MVSLEVDVSIAIVFVLIEASRGAERGKLVDLVFFARNIDSSSSKCDTPKIIIYNSYHFEVPLNFVACWKGALDQATCPIGIAALLPKSEMTKRKSSCKVVQVSVFSTVNLFRGKLNEREMRMLKVILPLLVFSFNGEIFMQHLSIECNLICSHISLV
ncbi:hypothetical protein Tsp_01766 [Trichinella spiralis]|uniref:hypothetical protein n=1 Tax=Trichinella spiralis TaxID=6334 RepID=UPI0001EFCC88|nr:hypothetical protein Tsp_01766 [Trichinella spiralis]